MAETAPSNVGIPTEPAEKKPEAATAGELPAGMNEQLQHVYDNIIVQLAASDTDPKGRAEALAKATQTPVAYPKGEAFTAWATNIDAYNASLRIIREQFLKGEDFDKERFLFAAVSEMFKLASPNEALPKEALSDRATFANTLFLMTEVGMLNQEDIVGLDTLTKNIPEAWKALSKQNLLDAGKIQPEDYKKLESLSDRVGTFSQTQLVDEKNPTSVVSLMKNAQESQANLVILRAKYAEAPQAKAA